MKMVNQFEFHFNYIFVKTNIMNGDRHVEA